MSARCLLVAAFLPLASSLTFGQEQFAAEPRPCDWERRSRL